jgi:hypothetical protein
MKYGKQDGSIKTGDLVKNLTDAGVGVGIVVETDILMWGQAHEPPGVKVLWVHPIWYDPQDGASVMYADELEVISEGR